MENTAERIRQALLSSRIRYQDEAQLHEAIGLVLAVNLGLLSLHEYTLGPSDRPDFFLPEKNLAIEVKVDGSCSDIIRQVHRYLGYEQVRGALVVTTKYRHSVSPIIRGKPVWLVRIQQGV